MEFSSDSKAKKALRDLHGLELDGRQLRVDTANPRGSSGRGGYGGGK